MRLFRVDFPNGKSFVVLNRNNWINLIDILNNYTNESSILITPLTFWESIKYILDK